MLRVRGQEAEQTLAEWKKHVMDAVQRRDAQESIEDSEVKSIKGIGAEGITTVMAETGSTLEAYELLTVGENWGQRALLTDKCCCEKKYGKGQT